MRRYYLLSLLTALLSVCCISTSIAQTAYAGLQSIGSTETWSAGNGSAFCMVGFNVTTPQKVAEVPFKGESTTNFQIAGCLAGEVYYAVMQDNSSNAVTLHSLNCATQNDIEIASTTAVSDMTYEATSGKVYAISRDGNSSDATTTLYELNVKDGSLTAVKAFANTVYFSIAAKDGKLYLAREEVISGLSYYLIVDAYDVTSDEVTTGEKIEKIGYIGDYNSMDFNEDKLYLMMGQRIVIADLEAKTVTIPTYTNFQGEEAVAFTQRQLSGICFAKSTKDAGESGEQPNGVDFIAGLNNTGWVTWNEGNGDNFCMVKFNTADVSTVTGVPFKGESDTNFEIAGCLAGNIYYAAMEDQDNYNRTLHSLNCATGKDVEIGSIDQVRDLTYNSDNGKLYATYRYFDDDSEGSAIYEVNTSTGAFTSVAKLKDVDAKTIAYHDGLFYLLTVDFDYSTYKSVYNIETYNLATGEADATTYANLEGLGYEGTCNSMEYKDGKLYLIWGRSVYTFDLETKTLTQAEGTLPKDVAGICFAESSEDAQGGGVTPEPQPENSAKVVVTEFYGSSMGDVDGMSGKTVSFYDKNNHAVRAAHYGKTYDTDEFALDRYYYNIYDEAGNLTTSYSQQYGLYDGGDWAFKAAKDTVYYTYDEQGRLLTKNDTWQSELTVYTYEGNNLVNEKGYITSSYGNTLLTDITYSDFVADGCPQTIVNNGAYTYLKYKETLTYNAAGQKTTRARKGYNEVWADGDTEPTLEEVDLESEAWTYDASGVLVSDSIAKSGYDEWGAYTGILEPSSKTVYSYDEGNTNRVVTKTYSPNVNSSTGKFSWVENATYSINETKELAPKLATNLTVSAVEGKINTQKLAFTIPDEAMLGGYVFDVYRNGIKLGRVQMSDEGAYDEETGMLTYTDADTKNDTYDYFVQTVQLDELYEEENTLNISSPVSYTAHVDLPAPTNVHGVKNTQDEVGRTLTTIAWDEPVGKDNYGFQRYNVMLANAQIADNAEDDGQATEWETNLEWENTVYVQAVYQYGKANSESVTIDVESLPTGIDEISTSANGAISVSYANCVLNIAAPANVNVFASNGALVQKASNATSINLSSLPKGSYVVTINVNGNMRAVKVAR